MSETADRAFTVEAARVGLASPEKDRCRGEKIEGSQRWEGRKCRRRERTQEVSYGDSLCRLSRARKKRAGGRWKSS